MVAYIQHLGCLLVHGCERAGRGLKTYMYAFGWKTLMSKYASWLFDQNPHHVSPLRGCSVGYVTSVSNEAVISLMSLHVPNC